jgi:stage V sporulation protein R
MTKGRYTLEDLQILDDKCLQEALAMGLRPPPTMFHLVQAEEIYDIAARGLPGRYSHYQFGRQYEQMKGNYDRGKGRIYELVINTEPAHAYLLDGNSIIAQFFVMAHVYGHTDFFEHNRYFAPADKNILTRTRAAAERIDHYMGEHGRAKVEDFIDACGAFEQHRDWDQLAKKPEAKGPVWEANPFASLFPEQEEERRQQHLLDKEIFKQRFPKQPEVDILRFAEKHATHLDDWQRDVISIIRTEAEYFVPMGRTQVMNEGWATRAHNRIVQAIMAKDDTFNTDDYMEFESSNASVRHPKIRTEQVMGDDGKPMTRFHCVGINPYLLGSLMWADIERICVDPTDKEKEKWSWAGNVDPDEFVDEIREVYDDRAFIAEFLTPTICEKAKVFKNPRDGYEAYKSMRILKDEFKWIRDYLVWEKTFLGIPPVAIVNANYRGASELYLEHHWEGQFELKGLDDEYCRGTLPLLYKLWGRPVTIKTIEVDEPEDDEEDLEPEWREVWYRCTGDSASKTLSPPDS